MVLQPASNNRKRPRPARLSVSFPLNCSNGDTGRNDASVTPPQALLVALSLTLQVVQAAADLVNRLAAQRARRPGLASAPSQKNIQPLGFDRSLAEIRGASALRRSGSRVIGGSGAAASTPRDPVCEPPEVVMPSTTPQAVTLHLVLIHSPSSSPSHAAVLTSLRALPHLAILHVHRPSASTLPIPPHASPSIHARALFKALNTPSFMSRFPHPRIGGLSSVLNDVAVAPCSALISEALVGVLATLLCSRLAISPTHRFQGKRPTVSMYLPEGEGVSDESGEDARAIALGEKAVMAFERAAGDYTGAVGLNACLLALSFPPDSLLHENRNSFTLSKGSSWQPRRRSSPISDSALSLPPSAAPPILPTFRVLPPSPALFAQPPTMSSCMPPSPPTTPLHSRPHSKSTIWSSGPAKIERSDGRQECQFLRPAGGKAIVARLACGAEIRVSTLSPVPSPYISPAPSPRLLSPDRRPLTPPPRPLPKPARVRPVLTKLLIPDSPFHLPPIPPRPQAPTPSRFRGPSLLPQLDTPVLASAYTSGGEIPPRVPRIPPTRQLSTSSYDSILTTSVYSQASAAVSRVPTMVAKVKLVADITPEMIRIMEVKKLLKQRKERTAEATRKVAIVFGENV